MTLYLVAIIALINISLLTNNNKSVFYYYLSFYLGKICTSQTYIIHKENTISMQKILFSVLTFFIFISVSFSQILDPVSWSFSVEQNGNEATLISKATLDKGWHIYSQNLEGEFGPVPTEFTYEKAENYSLEGKTIETKKPTVQFDKNFDMNVAYFSDEIIFKQKIKVNSATDFVLKGSVGYMVCDDEKCLPPTDEIFEFKLKGVKGGVEVNPNTTLNEKVRKN